MAMKYFVYEGLQFQSFPVERRKFAAYGDISPIEAVTLESVALALGTTALGSTATANPAALNELVKLWEKTGRVPPLVGAGNADVTDAFHTFSLDAVLEAAPLISGTVAGVDPSDTGRFHQLSWRWILPQGLAQSLYQLPADNSTPAEALQQFLFQSLEVRHDNIQKHTTPTDAWSAWRSYEVARQAQQELSTATHGYLVNPPSA